MSEGLKQIPFGKDILLFLKQEGYSHILCLGATYREDQPDGYEDDYRLQALKQDDPRLHFEETDFIVQQIESSEVLEMANGDPFIRFIIELPEQLTEKFYKGNESWG